MFMSQLRMAFFEDYLGKCGTFPKSHSTSFVYLIFFSLHVSGKQTSQFLHSIKKMESVDSFYLGHFKSLSEYFQVLTTF